MTSDPEARTTAADRAPSVASVVRLPESAQVAENGRHSSARRGSGQEARRESRGGEEGGPRGSHALTVRF